MHQYIDYGERTRINADDLIKWTRKKTPLKENIRAFTECCPNSFFGLYFFHYQF